MNEIAEATCYEPPFLRKIQWKFKGVKRRTLERILNLILSHLAKESNCVGHAKREFLAMGYKPISECEDDPNKWIQEGLIQLLQLFSIHGHSGSSAPFAISYFKKLAAFEPLVPLMGNGDEWNHVHGDFVDATYQNNRCSHVFKGGDGIAYDIQGKVFREPSGGCYTGAGSRVTVIFPYTPKIEYVDVKD